MTTTELVTELVSWDGDDWYIVTAPKFDYLDGPFDTFEIAERELKARARRRKETDD